MALIASYSGRPALAARAALKERYCWGITGESVMIENKIPALYSSFGVSKDIFASSNFDLWVNAGPQIHGKPLSLIWGRMLLASVTWSNVILIFSSFAIRIAVKISSALWAWHFNGSSLLTTGIMASSFWS